MNSTKFEETSEDCSWISDDEIDENDMSPDLQLFNARMYMFEMELSEEELRDVIGIEQQYIDEAKRLGPMED